MKRIAVFALLIFASVADAQKCWSPRWGTVVPVMQAPAPVYASPVPSTYSGWKQTAKGYDLIEADKVVGSYDASTDTFDGGDVARVPSALRSPKTIGQTLPTGVDPSGISPAPRYTRKGEEIRENDILNLLGDKKGVDGLVDDSKKDRVTFICADRAKRETAVKQFKSDPAYAPLRNAALVWDADPSDWSMEAGFPKDTGVMIQAFDGKVIARAVVEDIAKPNEVIGALRRANPKYDPTKDPTNKTPSLNGIDLSNIPTTWWAVGALIAYLLWSKR